ncbi:MAG: phosphoglycolate phosphatase [Betaproteobacteria bacterium]
MSAPLPMLEIGGVAIDLDGTLLDTIHDLAAAVNALLVDGGQRPLPKERIRMLVGKGMANLIRRALAESRGVAPQAISEADAQAALIGYQAHYQALLGNETRIFPGVLDGLVRLRAMGLPLAIVTNKASRFVRPHLVRAGIEHYFDLVLGAEALPTRKPEPGPLLHVAHAFGVTPAQLLMVGDSINDAQAARAAGCPVLIVPYGYNEGEPVQSIDADGIVPSLAAVADCVRAMPALR